MQLELFWRCEKNVSYHRSPLRSFFLCFLCKSSLFPSPLSFSLSRYLPLAFALYGCFRLRLSARHETELKRWSLTDFLDEGWKFCRVDREAFPFTVLFNFFFFFSKLPRYKYGLLLRSCECKMCRYTKIAFKLNIHFDRYCWISFYRVFKFKTL